MMNNLVCPHCSHSTIQEHFCSECNKVLPIRALSYFDVFRLSENYNIDIKQLDTKLFELQRCFHPDKFINQSLIEQSIALNNSALINQAYKVLKTPLLRAEYLLKLKGFDIDKEEVPQHLLLESMEWRESLESSEDERSIRKLLEEVSYKENNAYKLLTEYFIKELYNQALSIYIELKFYTRFKLEIINKLDLINDTI
ncbi:co-chaperone HscB [endosymbiont of Acanthamoeba sp. UWC8]|uniref:Fe-S protein assembly co-chaperone HscB n=1 Tax=endosymbiont of Acanthamoeba sp. UWC8 TaxID=86106 RepID=UPI0004D0C788|nr:Fe-S protein assembly co-chaperone HscB [endosymbiont of Acanthamoeba sp. UWC8]AIF81594.1 co-chaperone HscB [endosymbiont of Acanthamoeba sp. UWC8]